MSHLEVTVGRGHHHGILSRPVAKPTEHYHLPSINSKSTYFIPCLKLVPQGRNLIVNSFPALTGSPFLTYVLRETIASPNEFCEIIIWRSRHRFAMKYCDPILKLDRSAQLVGVDWSLRVSHVGEYIRPWHQNCKASRTYVGVLACLRHTESNRKVGEARGETPSL